MGCRVHAKSYTPSHPCMIWHVTPSDLLLGVGGACQILHPLPPLYDLARNS